MGAAVVLPIYGEVSPPHRVGRWRAAPEGLKQTLNSLGWSATSGEPWFANAFAPDYRFATTADLDERDRAARVDPPKRSKAGRMEIPAPAANRSVLRRLLLPRSETRDRD